MRFWGAMAGQVSAYRPTPRLCWVAPSALIASLEMTRHSSKQSLMLPAAPPMGGPVAKTALTLATDCELIESGEGQ
jgi:hypothetical protein